MVRLLGKETNTINMFDFAIAYNVTVALPVQFSPSHASVQWHVYPSNSSTHVAPFAQEMIHIHLHLKPSPYR